MLQFLVLKQNCNISHFITTRQGGVGITTADCFPILLYDPDKWPELVRQLAPVHLK